MLLYMARNVAGCDLHWIAGQGGNVKIKARSSESVEQLLRRFKKACEKEGLTRSMKRIAYYEKPSVTRNRRKRQALKRKLQSTMLSQM
jgi:small subunit ribosomal protein S21